MQIESHYPHQSKKGRRKPPFFDRLNTPFTGGKWGVNFYSPTDLLVSMVYTIFAVEGLPIRVALPPKRITRF